MTRGCVFPQFFQLLGAVLGQLLIHEHKLRCAYSIMFLKRSLLQQKTAHQKSLSLHRAGDYTEDTFLKHDAFKRSVPLTVPGFQ